ncbi:MAG TPA: NADP-dependent oxidoreductase [Prolixibacteraceae bacterium]|nr:NADP-dependent oxidoreductase [Prolixibacteraceae bacterium]
MEIRQIVLASRPQGVPTLDNFRIEVLELPPLEDDEVLVQGLYYSVDPYMRGRMNEAKSYISTFEINQPISGGVVGKILKSNISSLKVGDHVLGRLPWREQINAPIKLLQVINPTIAPPSYYLGILGMPGLTAYFGLLEICKPKAGETGVVSGAAGAVGMVVGQLARIQGCRMVGITGSDEKAGLLKSEFGFEEVINYKTTPDLREALAKACPMGIHFYFDNVGGDISDAVLGQINSHARIAICGQISLYNSTEVPLGPRIQPQLLARNALMQGFSVSNYQNRFGEGFQRISRWIREGKLKYRETIIKGFDQLPHAFIGLFKGDNMGKMIVEP